jgi:hypothetical protein
MVGCAVALLGSPIRAEPQSFATPEQAVAALKTALAKDDRDALIRIFGSEFADDIIGPDPVSTRVQRRRAAAAARDGIKIERHGTDEATLHFGKNAWPFPVPLVRDPGKGSWSFDTAEGLDEILARRIGQNELAAIAALKEFVRAEKAYAAKYKVYASYVQSRPGMTDGLWWDEATAKIAGPSPLAKYARAQREFLDGRRPGDPFRGYYFRIVTGQGANAPGGAMSYLENGRMTKGFAMVAWPADYRNSGVMTFQVDRSGKILQIDLGEETESLAQALRVFDPGDGWAPAE